MTTAPDSPDRGGSSVRIPWERRRELGWPGALVETLRESLFHPSAFFRRLDPRGPILPALVFAVLVSYAAVLIQILWELLIPGNWWGGLPVPEEARGVLSTAALSLGVLLFVPVLVPLWLFFASALLHAALLLLGGPSRGYAGTLQVLAYAGGPQLLAILPFCGSLVGAVWSVVLGVIGLREVHGIPTSKAVAVMLLPLLLCGVVAGALVLFVLLTAGGAALRSL